MPADEQITSQEHNQPTAAPQQSAKQARPRQSDDGPEILPCMEHFVTLVRKAKRPGLALLLVERASATSLPEVAALTDAAKGILAVQSRKAMFHAVAKLGSDVNSSTSSGRPSAWCCSTTSTVRRPSSLSLTTRTSRRRCGHGRAE
jgi:hypothetical protein